MALPATLNPARPAGNDAATDPASTIDNQIRDLKQLIADILGIPVDPTSLTAAWFSGTAAGVVTIAQSLVSPTISGAAPATPVANRLYTDSFVKGWLRTSGAGVWTIDADLNVSSITDNAAGDFTINWATAFANANYAVVGIVRGAATTVAPAHSVRQHTATAPLTTAVRLQTVGQSTGAGTEYDLALVDPEVGVYIMAIGSQ